MNIHEYQAKALFRDYGVATQQGRLALTADEAQAACATLGGGLWVVKAQVHAGGRGKGGGIRLCRSPGEARDAAEALLGSQLVTPQTGPEGVAVRAVYVEAGCDIARELYLGMVLDRERERMVMMASTEGGVEIEAVAAATPEKILKVELEPDGALPASATRELAQGLALEGRQVDRAIEFMLALAKMAQELDCSIVEINPLVITSDDRVIALDAKVNFDDSALFRHPEIGELRDTAAEEPLEARASAAGLNYIKLDGRIGCMVNGAGLAMATMDLIKLHGGEPANFLDVGGGATAEQVTEGFRIILSDPEVEAIFVNIFGGIMRCDFIAEGIIAAAREVEIGVPLVVRLEGTNVELGRRMLDESGLALITASDMDDGARKAIAAAGGA
ncbi:MAG TPA: ADP-forming succinate--CoA ligase subunit beta [Candidatus Poseidoniales archaeon]|nr:ADP-forming succinate--CoA ligase subunit beta [Candidatus Poseidoniales archaeon]